MFYIVSFIVQILIELAFIVIFLFVTKKIFYALWNKFIPDDKRQIFRINHFLMFLIVFISILLFIEFISRPTSLALNDYAIKQVDSFNGFVYQPGTATITVREDNTKGTTIALFKTMKSHPEKISYIDFRREKPIKGFVSKYQVLTPRPNFQPEDFEYIRVSYTDDKSLCENDTSDLENFIKPSWFAYFRGDNVEELLGDGNTCLVVKKISASEVSHFEFRPPYSKEPKKKVYFFPFFHRRSSFFPLISPSDREKYRVQDYSTNKKEAYIYSSLNGIFFGSIIQYFGWKLSGFRDEKLIEEFLEKYIK